MLPDKLSETYSIQLPNFLAYYGLRNAIPRLWKNVIKQYIGRKDRKVKELNAVVPLVAVKGKIIGIKYVGNKVLYNILMDQKTSQIIISTAIQLSDCCCHGIACFGYSLRQ